MVAYPLEGSIRGADGPDRRDRFALTANRVNNSHVGLEYVQVRARLPKPQVASTVSQNQAFNVPWWRQAKKTAVTRTIPNKPSPMMPSSDKTAIKELWTDLGRP